MSDRIRRAGVPFSQERKGSS
ncbi:hypothetical protein CGLO_14551 [Colletotrichum gloeosporioides Cg-14]|uniref:Uncharacterized protein n=1 Tax=Colletotrichum gloeosporioides (strain Cg-14) TaxID=1237896 RepID=T0L410_COLGC|nr:hypothetical protein CGLO_14551 [Colletotrichum gloeosporioides Cg-14]